MPVIQIGAQSYKNPSEEITLAMLGGEYLGNESLGYAMGNFNIVGVNHLRWPGGIQSEDLVAANGDYIFDLSTLDVMTWQRNGGISPTMSEILQQVVDNSMSLAVVAPTARYVNEMLTSGATLPPPSAYDDMYVFLSRMYQSDPVTGLNGFGVATAELPDLTIEIGSEYYSTREWARAIESGVSVDELAYDFGLVFADMARAIGDFEAANGVAINTAIQTGRFQSDGIGSQPASLASLADNAAFIEAFEDLGVLDVVDSVIWHRYADNFDQTGHGVISDVFGTNLGEVIALWEAATGNPDLQLVSGWLAPDVRSPGELAAAGDNDHWGARSLPSILQQFAVLAGAGMDVGTIYALGSNINYGSLSQAGDLFIGGQLYQMMAKSLPGMYLHEGYEDHFSPAGGDLPFYEYHFSNEYSVVSFFAAQDLDFIGNQEFSVFAEYSESVVDVVGTRLFDPDGIDVISSVQNTAIGVIGEFGDVALSVDQSGNGVNFGFQNDFEVVRLVMYLENVEIGRSFSLADHSEEIVGLTLTGDGNIDGIGNGNDNTLVGNVGNNVLIGNAGDDVIQGNGGQDTLEGGAGSDILVGGAGGDILVGGAGADTFIFGAEDIVDWDSLSGNASQRSAQLDIIQDFEIGIDSIDLGMLLDDKDGSGLNFWEENVDGDLHIAIQVIDTNQRLLVNVDDNVDFDYAVSQLFIGDDGAVICDF